MLKQTNKWILLIGGHLLCTVTLFSQSTLENTKPSLTQVSSSQHSEDKTNLSEAAGILEKYLGVSSVEDPEYAARKLELKETNPEAYEKMLAELVAKRSNGKNIISRAQYEAMSPERKAVIDANPDQYIIQD